MGLYRDRWNGSSCPRRLGSGAGGSVVTEEDDNSLRAIEYGCFQEWGEGERADAHGVEVYSDSEATV